MKIAIIESVGKRTKFFYVDDPKIDIKGDKISISGTIRECAFKAIHGRGEL